MISSNIGSGHAPAPGRRRSRLGRAGAAAVVLVALAAVGTIIGNTGASAQATDPDAMVVQLGARTGACEGDATAFDLPFHGDMDITVDWGDGTSNQYGNGSEPSHAYADRAARTIQITGWATAYGRPNSAYPAMASCITGVDQWGSLGITDLAGAFRGATNLTSVPTSLPSGVTTLRRMFESAKRFNGDVSGWDVGSVTDMSYAFYDAKSFDRDLAGWNFASVTDAGGMLQNAISYDHSLGAWNLAQMTYAWEMLGSSGLSPRSYSDTLIGWAAQVAAETMRPNVPFYASGQRYKPDAESARTALLAANWYIDGDSLIDTTPMTLTWDPTTTSCGTRTVELAFSRSMDGTIEWGDGSSSVATSTGTYLHTYSDDAAHTISVSGDVGAFGDGEAHPGGPCFTSVNDWGGVRPRGLPGAFRGWTHLVSVPNSLPWGVNDLSNTFRDATSFNGNLMWWGNLESATTTAHMFHGATSFDSYFGNIYLGNVIDASSMFEGATSFNGDVANWDLRSARTLDSMFKGATSFNHSSIGNWNVRQVVDMDSMFEGASSFGRGELANWMPYSLTDARSMFTGSALGTYDYSRILESWGAQSLSYGATLDAPGAKYRAEAAAARTHLVADLGWTITDAGPAGTAPMVITLDTRLGDFDGWIVLPFSNIQSLHVDWGDGTTSDHGYGSGQPSHYFGGTRGVRTITVTGLAGRYGTIDELRNSSAYTGITSFGDLELTDISGAFANQPNMTQAPATLPSTVTNLDYAFMSATSFNGDVSGWDTSNVRSMVWTFRNAPAFTGGVSGWNTSRVVDMRGMFADALTFNGDLSGWNTSNVTDMNYMFTNARAFNGNVSTWNTSKVTDMRSMFEGAWSFNSDVGSWEVSSVIGNGLVAMFYDARAFDRSLASWRIRSSNLERLIEGSAMTSMTYSNTLIGWAADSSISRNIYAGVGYQQYLPSAVAAHDTLVNLRGWALYDGGLRDMSPMRITYDPSVGCNDTTASITLGGPLDVTIDWGDGSTATATTTPGTFSHTYAAGSTARTISIAGAFAAFGDGLAHSGTGCYTAVTQWGNPEFTKLSGAFRGWSKLTSVPNSLPSRVTDVSRAFQDATSFASELWGWGSYLEGTTDFSHMFDGASSFNGSIFGWNVGSGRNFSSMFRNARSYDRDMWIWSMSNATDLSSMFEGATSFKANIGNWNVANVTTMAHMFEGATAYDRPYLDWTPLALTDATSMFDRSGLSSYNYSRILDAWSIQSLRTGVTLGASTSRYRPASAAARTHLATDLGWTIVDAGPMSDEPLSITIDTTKKARFDGVYTLPIGEVLDVTIDWGDGSPTTHLSAGETNPTHDYSGAPGAHTITVTGFAGRFGDHEDGRANAIVTGVSSFGDLELKSLDGALAWMPNLVNFPASLPSTVTDIGYLFMGSTNFNGDVSVWDTSHITRMAGTFREARSFDRDLRTWDVSRVTSLTETFAGASSFDGDISTWNVANVTSLESTFYGAGVFNGNLSSWNVSRVTNMTSTFQLAEAFDRDISGWNTANVTTMSSMFNGARSFRQDISGWNTANVTDMTQMFRGTQVFNADIGRWNVSAITGGGLDLILYDAKGFHRSLGAWTLSVSSLNAAIQGSGMGPIEYSETLVGWAANPLTHAAVNANFSGSYVLPFAQSARDHLINGAAWNIYDAGAYDLTPMLITHDASTACDSDTVDLTFGGSVAVTIDWGDGTTPTDVRTAGTVSHTYDVLTVAHTISISGLTTRFGDGTAHAGTGCLTEVSQWGNVGITELPGAFRAWTNLRTVPSTLPGPVTDLSNTFRDAVNFDAELDDWRWGISTVTTFAHMFDGARSFSRGLPNWRPEAAVSFDSMFRNATSFNGDITYWYTWNVTSMASMFEGATSFDQDISGWPVVAVTSMAHMFQGATSFSRSLGAWDPIALVDATSMFDGSGLTSYEYSRTIEGWGTRDLRPNGTLGAAGLRYRPAAATAHDHMVIDLGWTITDAGPGGTTAMEVVVDRSSSFSITIPLWGVYDATIDWGDGSPIQTLGLGQDSPAHDYAADPNPATILIKGFATGYGDINGHLGSNNVREVRTFGDLEISDLAGAFAYMPSLTRAPATLPTGITTLAFAFVGDVAFNGDISGWDTSKVTSMARMFDGATSFNGAIGGWNVANLVDTRWMFRNDGTFDRDLSAWNTSKLRYSVGMFQGATAFRGNVSTWDMRSVLAMDSMFAGATSFNGDVSSWNVSGVKSMRHAFDGATAFNADISGWNISSIVSNGLEGLLRDARSFDRSLGSWRVWNTSLIDVLSGSGLRMRTWSDTLVGWAAQSSNLRRDVTVGAVGLRYMPYAASAMTTLRGLGWFFEGTAPKDLTPMVVGFDRVGTSCGTETIEFALTGFVDVTIDWGDGSPTELFSTPGIVSHTFRDTIGASNISLSGDLTGFGDGSTHAGRSCFTHVSSFGKLGITSLAGAFRGWDHLTAVPAATPEGLTDMSNMFRDASAFNAELIWNTDHVTTMAHMFDGATSFDGWHSSWNISNVTDMSYMFRDARAYVGHMGGWDLSNLVNAAHMFDGATSFQEDNWVWFTGANRLVDASYMFRGATSFNGAIGGWRTSTVTNMAHMFDGATKFDRNLSAWDVAHVTDMTGMLDGTLTSIWNYTRMLQAWAAQPVQQGVVFGAAGVRHASRAFDARASLITDDGWTITDGAPLGTRPLVLHVDTTAPGCAASISLELQGVAYADIAWGDGTTMSLFETDRPTHDYSGVPAGTYEITVTGLVDRFGSVGGITGFDCFTGVSSLGDLGARSLNGAMAYMRNVTTDVPSELPDTVTDISNFFLNGDLMVGDVSGWDTSRITGMESVFSNARRFNGDLSGWNTSNVTNMMEMFQSASTFNGDLSTWDTSKVTDMEGMFTWTPAFNGDVTTWDTSSVRRMGRMFREAPSFDRDISGWNTSNVIQMHLMFSGASSFNADISRWNTAKVMGTNSMFEGAVAFDRDLSAWDTSSVGTMEAMFSHATTFNGDVTTWNTANVHAMNRMFEAAVSFNRDISHWNVANVTDMTSMFQGASKFNAAIGRWNVGATSGEALVGMLKDASAFNRSLGTWDLAGITTLRDLLPGSGLRGRAYSETLKGWWANPTTPNGILLDAGTIMSLPDAESARAGLLSKGWTLADGGQRDVWPLEFTWDPQTSCASDAFELGVHGYMDASIDWGDGEYEDLTLTEGGLLRHVFAAGDATTAHTISMIGEVDGFGDATVRTSATCITEVRRWGSVGLRSLEDAFHGWSNLVTVPATLPDTVTDLSGAFEGAVRFNGDLASWNVANVTDMASMFRGATAFDRPLATWSVSSVTSMAHMFDGASRFDQLLAAWTPTALRDATAMFTGSRLGAYDYSRILESWSALPLQRDVHLDAPGAKYRPAAAPGRNSLIGDLGWTITDGGPAGTTPVTLVVDTTAPGATANVALQFTEVQDLLIDWGDGSTPETFLAGQDRPTHVYLDAAGPHTVTVTGYARSFGSATPFDGGADIVSVSSFGDLELRSVAGALAHMPNLMAAPTTLPSSVSSLDGLFRGSSSFDGDLSGWSTSNITSMHGTFEGAASFRHDLSAWDVSHVTDLGSIFAGATAFTGDVSGWNTAAVTDMSRIFEGATAFAGDLSNWNVARVTTMDHAFSGATKFAADISAWNVGQLTDADSMFQGAIGFHSDLSNWNVARVTTMASMFAGATKFDGDVSHWNMSSVTGTGMVGVFSNATSFTRSLAAWDISHVTSLEGLLSNTSLRTRAYSDTLIAWASASTTPDGIILGAEGLHFSAEGHWAHDALVAKGWNISDAGPRDMSPMAIGWETSSSCASNTVELAVGGYVDVEFDWGDGTPRQQLLSAGSISHTYATSGNHTVLLYGEFDRFGDGAAHVGTGCLTGVWQWGNTAITALPGAFRGWSNLRNLPSTLPGPITDLSNAFRDATRFEGVLVDWDVSATTDFSHMFEGATSFNRDLLTWNMAKATNLSAMFRGATTFDADISNWNVGRVTDMSHMFDGATSFQGRLWSWTPTSLVDASEMFTNSALGTFNYSKLLEAWSVAGLGRNVTFGAPTNTYRASSAPARALLTDGLGWSITDAGVAGTQPMTIDIDTSIEGFDGRYLPPVTSILDVTIDWGDGSVPTHVVEGETLEPHQYVTGSGIRTVSISGYANAFGSTDHYDGVGAVVAMGSFGDLELRSLHGALANTRNLTDAVPTTLPRTVTDLSGLFAGSRVVNPTISTWDTSRVTTLLNTFASTERFNGDVSTWDTSHVTVMAGAFAGAIAFDGDLTRWNLSSVVDAGSMFAYARSFRGDLSGWNTSSIRFMHYMFSAASSFDADLSGWDTSHVEMMNAMFKDASSFDADLGSWNLSSITGSGLSEMFAGATSFDHSLGAWNLSRVTDMTDLLSGSGMHARAYSATLMAWAAAPTTPHDILLGASGVHYHSYAAAARGSLRARGWNITDAGLRSTVPMVITYAPTSTACGTTSVEFGLSGYIDIDVDWGDGSTPVHFDAPQTIRHDYAGSVGSAAISISGDLDGFGDGALHAGRDCLTSVTSWGAVQIHTLRGAFRGWTNLTTVPSSQPGPLTDLSGAFRDATSFDGPIGGWDTSSVTDLSYVVAGARSFRTDIGGWTTNSVQSMAHAFDGAIAFDSSLTNWRTGNVIDLSSMFAGARSMTFGSWIDGWDVAKVTDMAHLFDGAASFDRSLTAWNPVALSSAAGVLDGTSISVWNYGLLLQAWSPRVTASGVAFGAANHQYPVVARAAHDHLTTDLGWTVTDGGSLTGEPLQVVVSSDAASCTSPTVLTLPLRTVRAATVDWGDGTSLQHLVEGQDLPSHTYANPGNRTISVTGVVEGYGTTDGISGTNCVVGLPSFGDIGLVHLDGAMANLPNLTTSVPTSLPLTARTLGHVFSGSRSINGDVSAWDTSRITSMASAFRGAESFTGDVSRWSVGSVTDMSSMFEGAVRFDGDLAGWNVAKVTNLEAMFAGATSFDRPIGSWNVAAATSLRRMFDGAASFDQDLSAWNTAKVTDMTAALRGAVSLDRSFGTWNLASVRTMDGILDGTQMRVRAISDTLIGWAAQSVVPRSQTQDLSGTQLNAAGITARDRLVSNFGWTFVGADLWVPTPLRIVRDPGATSCASTTAELAFSGYTDVNVDWGDGTIQHVDAAGVVTHTYTDGATREIHVSGQLDGFGDGLAHAGAGCFTSLADFGHLGFVGLSGAFRGWSNLHTVPAILPLGITDLSGAFRDATIFDGDLSAWNTSKVTTLDHAFDGAAGFDRSLGSWRLDSLVTAIDLFAGSGESIANWSASLKGWSERSGTAHDVTVGSGGVRFHRSAQSARDHLSGIGWAITDGGIYDPVPMLLTFDASVCGTRTVNLPLRDLTAETFVEWGDGDVTAVGGTSVPLHTYASGGVHQIRVGGAFTGFGDVSGWTGRQCITTVDAWGVNGVTDLAGAFGGATALHTLPAQLPATVTNLDHAFSGTKIAHTGLEGWNVGAVTDFSNAFAGADLTDVDLSAWDTSNATRMDRMFAGATNFDSAIAAWDVADVTTFAGMFEGDASFDSNLSAWSTSSATDMSSMFRGASAFDQPLDTWDVSNVTNMTHMFDGATSFDRSLGAWNLASGANLSDGFACGGFSRTNWSSTLDGWAGDATIATGVTLDECALQWMKTSTASRTTLTDAGWTFVHAGAQYMRIPDVPSTVTSVGTDRGADVSWLAPFDGDGEITGYSVRVRDSRSITAAQCSTTGSATLGCSVAGLGNGATYTVTVTASNEVGTTAESAPIEVMPIAAPAAPEAPSVTVRSQGATVTWSVPFDNGSPITGFDVSARLNGSEVATCSSTASTDSSCDVTGLTDGSDHTFVVRAVNAVGTGEWSPATTKLVGGVPAAPVNIVVTAAYRSLVVSWPVVTMTPGIRGYEVVASVDGVPAGSCTTSSSSSVTCTIGGLTIGQPYVVSVTATNWIGVGETGLAPAAVAPIPQLPSAPTDLVATQIDLGLSYHWNAPLSNGGGAILSYTVTLDDSARVRHTCTTTDVDARTCTFTGLPLGGATAKVLATNAAGSGTSTFGLWTDVATTPAVPFRPSVTVSSGGARMSAYTESNGSAITLYEISVRLSGNEVTTCSWNPSISGQNGCNVSGLTNGTRYDFHVRATNAIGTSDWSRSSLMLIGAVPGTPTDVGAIVGDERLTVTWSSVTADPAVTTYTAVASYQGGMSGWCQADGASTSCSIGGLTNGLDYTVRVSASNSIGEGAASAETGPFSPKSPVVIPSIPSSVTATPGNGTATIAWKVASNGGAALTTSTATVKDEFDITVDTCSPAILTNLDALSCSVDGLGNGATYSVTITASNIAGTSDPSAPVTVTPRTIPSVPSSVRTTPTNLGATINWAITADGGAPVTTSTATVKNLAGAVVKTCSATSLADLAAMSCSVSGLTNGTTYNVSVTATNAAGTTAASSNVTVIPAVPPAVPSSVAVTNVDGGGSITWKVATNGGSALTASVATVKNSAGTTITTCSAATLGNLNALSCSVSGLTNGTAYKVTVTATNLAGSSAASTAVAYTPIGKPAAPAAPAVTAGNGSATINWGPPATGGSPITGYTVVINGTDYAACSNMTATTCTATGLQNGANATFAVRAKNAIGWGATSTATTVMIGVKPNAPTNVVPTAGDRSLVVKWTVPYGVPGPSYTATAYAGTVEAANCTAGPTVSTQTCTIKGLDAGTAYTVKVAASNGIGTTTSAATSAVTVYGSPSAPSIVSVERGNGAARVDWTPSVDDGGRFIDKYTVFAYKAGAVASSANCSTTGTATVDAPDVCVVNGLVNGTAYTFKVQAHNSVGNGAFSAASTTVTPTTVPTMPLTPSVTRDDGKLIVKWAAPTNIGTGFKNYSVVVTKADGTATAFTCSVTSASVGTCTVTGVSNTTAYLVKVEATNVIGDGLFTDPVAAAAGTAPSAPKLLKATSGTTGSKKITFEWSAPVSTGGLPITSYEVRQGTKVVCTTTTISCIATLTTTGTASYTVYAKNAVGWSVASNALSGTSR